MTHKCRQYDRCPHNPDGCPSCAPSPSDQNVTPSPAPIEPDHIRMVKGGIERRILKSLATREVMAAIVWEDWHPADYRTPQ
jgi:hypothetical protein